MKDIENDNQRMIPEYTVESFISIMAEVTDYNHRLMNVPDMWRKTRGEGIKLVVLDTGAPNHPDIKLAGSWSAIPDYLEDKNGHSTHCCGIIAAIADNGMGCRGISPNVELYAGAVLDGNGSGSAGNIARGIRWAVDTVKADVISMSLGMAQLPTSLELKAACDYAFKKNVVLLAASGNEATKVGQPACYDSTIGVAAVDEAQKHAVFSNFGKQVEFAAGGVNVYSTYLNNGYAKLSGTSMATPALAGVVALIMSDALKGASPRRLTPDEVREKLKKIAYDVGPKGWDEQFGFGIPVFSHNDNDIVEVPPMPAPDKPDSCFSKYLARISKVGTGSKPSAAKRLKKLGNDILEAAAALEK
jgi:subtilisin